MSSGARSSSPPAEIQSSYTATPAGMFLCLDLKHFCGYSFQALRHKYQLGKRRAIFHLCRPGTPIGDVISGSYQHKAIQKAHEHRRKLAEQVILFPCTLWLVACGRMDLLWLFHTNSHAAGQGAAQQDFSIPHEGLASGQGRKHGSSFGLRFV